MFARGHYRLFITIYENADGTPVVQLYDDADGDRKYTNIYYRNGQLTRDSFVSDSSGIKMNGVKVSEELWSQNITGYNKILLCAVLADSSHSSGDLLKAYGIDYDYTLRQTYNVTLRLSQKDTSSEMAKFSIVEADYISLYLQQWEKSNRVRGADEFTESHDCALYDMNQDGIPELILYEGSSGAGTHHHFYTITGNTAVDCGEYGRTNLLFNNAGEVIAYHGRMGYYLIDKITLSRGGISITNIAEGETRDPYPELEEFWYYDYHGLAYCPAAIPLVFYMYSAESQTP